VSWLGELIGFRPNEEEQASPPHTFDFAFLSEKGFCDNPVCPQCNSMAHPELIEGIEGVDIHVIQILGDLMMCTDCSFVYAVVEYPVLPVNTPIMTRWTVPEKIYKKK
jgi:hypothetical protein